MAFENGPPFNGELEVAEGGGMKLLTRDVFVKAAVWRCRQLERENVALRRIRDNTLVDTRVIKREVRAIRRIVSN